MMLLALVGLSQVRIGTFETKEQHSPPSLGKLE